MLWPVPTSVLHLLAAPRAPPRVTVPTAGVPGFCTWVTETAPDCLIEVPDGFSASVVAFDMNAILHTALRRATSSDDAIKLCYSKLHSTLRRVVPGSVVLLAVDGPAPLAKLATQLKRRRKTFNKEAASSKKKGAQAVSSLAITPGTRFMDDFENAMLYFCCAELAAYRARGLTFWMSGSDVAGEGEIKLLGALRQIERARAQREQRGRASDAPEAGRGASRTQASRTQASPPAARRRSSVVLVGQDGDLVLQALMLSPSWQVRSH